MPGLVGYKKIAEISIEQYGKAYGPTASRPRVFQAARVGTYSSRAAESYAWFAVSLILQIICIHHILMKTDLRIHEQP